jgi:hypothetical protein
VDFIVDVIARAEAEGARTVEAEKKAQEEWKDLIESMCAKLLVRFTDSWWNGGNVAGKKTQMLTFPGGIDVYEKMCREKLETWDGFSIGHLNKEQAQNGQTIQEPANKEQVGSKPIDGSSNALDTVPVC